MAQKHDQTAPGWQSEYNEICTAKMTHRSHEYKENRELANVGINKSVRYH